MIVDGHIHVFGDEGSLPQAWNDAYAKLWAYSFFPPRDWQKAAKYVMLNMLDPDGSLMMADLKQAGVDVGVCMGLDYGLGCHQEQATPVEEVNRWHADLQKKYPGKYYAYFCMDPRRKNSLKVFEKAIKEWGMKGLKLYPTNGFYVSDDVCQPFYKKCLEWGVPITIHTAPSPMPLVSKFAHPMHFSEVRSKYPDLVVVLAHGGYTGWWEICLGIIREDPHTYIDLATLDFEAFREPGRFISMLARARDYIGAERIIFGSDHWSGPRFSGEKNTLLPKWVQFFKDLPEAAKQYGYTFTQREVDLILCGNALRVLGLEAPPSPAEAGIATHRPSY